MSPSQSRRTIRALAPDTDRPGEQRVCRPMTELSTESTDALLAAMRRIASAFDARRRKAERDLHDGVQQHMALLGLKISLLRGLIRTDACAAEAMCAELTTDLQ